MPSQPSKEIGVTYFRGGSDDPYRITKFLYWYGITSLVTKIYVGDSKPPVQGVEVTIFDGPEIITLSHTTPVWIIASKHGYVKMYSPNSFSEKFPYIRNDIHEVSD